MAKPNYSFEKRRREMENPRKKEEKRQRKLAERQGRSGDATASTPEASWSRSYASTSSGCQVSAEVTIIAITHRPAWLASADTILRFDGRGVATIRRERATEVPA